MIDISIKEILELLPNSTSLIYVDYRDSLDEHPQLLQRCIHEGNRDALYEGIDDYWYQEAEWEGVKEYQKELIKDIQKKYECSEEEAEDYVEQNEDDIIEEIYNRCDDDTVKDLLRNTRNPICHYDTGYSIDEETWNWSNVKVRLERMKLKHFLKITSSKFDKEIDMMLMQCNGGQLLIYFEAEIDDFCRNEVIKSISFTDAYIGVVDHYQGGGDVMDGCLKGITITLPFNKENIFLEKSIDYNWTYSIAGMCSDWCEETKYSFGFEDVGEVETSKTNNFLQREAKLDAKFKNGDCTAGDMKYDRHRNIEYINNYPCGNKCTKCGTFWID